MDATGEMTLFPLVVSQETDYQAHCKIHHKHPQTLLHLEVSNGKTLSSAESKAGSKGTMQQGRIPPGVTASPTEKLAHAEPSLGGLGRQAPP